jgi:hypothetical protein
MAMAESDQGTVLAAAFRANKQRLKPTALKGDFGSLSGMP